MIYIGIDPGGSGGIAALWEHGGIVLASRMPETPRDVLDLLSDIVFYGGAGQHLHAMIEQVGVMPKQGIVSAFTFGRNIGGLHMALTSARIPYDQVLPAKWQLVMQCRSGGDKNITKRRAQQLFPLEKVTHAIADALLIAEYCRRIQPGSGRQQGDGTHGKEENGAAQVNTEAGHKVDIRAEATGPVIFAGGRRGGNAGKAAQARRAVGPAPRHGAGSRRQAR